MPAELTREALAAVSPITAFFDVAWVAGDLRYHFKCLCKNVNSAHDSVVRAWRGKSSYTVKPDNLLQHFVKHETPFAAAFWASEADDPVDMVAAINRASSAKPPWSLKDFAEWWKDNNKLEWATRWLFRVAVAYRALPAAPTSVLVQKPAVKVTHTLQQVLARMESGSGRDKFTIGIHEVLLFVKEGLPFRLAESVGFELLLGKTRAQLPNRDHVRALVDVLYSVVVQELEVEFRRAPSFSIMFDAWSSRSLSSSFLAVLYTYIDDAFKYREVLLDVIPLGDRRHTGDTLALEVARRIDSHTSASQFLYGSTTDNAKNVVNAAREVVHCLPDLVQRVNEGSLEIASMRMWIAPNARNDDVVGDDDNDNDDEDFDGSDIIREDLAGLRAHDEAAESHVAAPVVDVASMRQLASDERRVAVNVNVGISRIAPIEVAAEVDIEDDDDEPLSNLDRNRAHQCYLHDLNLVTLTAIKNTPRIAKLISKVDAIVAAVSKSTVRQKMLACAQKTLSLKPLKLLKRCPTRWNSLQMCLTRFVECYPALRCLQLENAFASCARKPKLPTRGEVVVLGDVARALEPIKVLTKLLETTTNSMAFLPLFTVALLRKLAPDAMLSVIVSDLRDKLLQQVIVRLQKHIIDGSQPSLLAAMVHPSTSPFLFEALTWFKSEAKALEVLKLGAENLVVWLQDYFVGDEDGAEEQRAKKPRYLEGNNDNAVVSQRSRVAALTDLLHELLALFDTSPAMSAADRRVVWSTASMAQADAALQELFTASKWSPLAPLVKLLMSLSPVSAGAERCFSNSGRINAPLRNKMDDSTLEMLTVLQCYLAKNDVNHKELAGKMKLFLDKLTIT